MNLSDLKFKMTRNMIEYCIEFNERKKIYDELNRLYENINDEKILSKIDRLAEELDYYRDLFVKTFRKENKRQIKKYIELKNKEF